MSIYVYMYTYICKHFVHILHILYKVQNVLISPDVMQVFYALLTYFMLKIYAYLCNFTCITSGEISKF